MKKKLREMCQMTKTKAFICGNERDLASGEIGESWGKWLRRRPVRTRLWAPVAFT
jgi:hypothetical protein